MRYLPASPSFGQLITTCGSPERAGSRSRVSGKKPPTLAPKFSSAIPKMRSTGSWTYRCASNLVVDGYRRDCEEMVSRFGALHSPERGDQVAKTCSLMPDAVKDKLTVVQMADRALVGTEKKETYPWFLLCRALVHYRAEEYLHVHNKLGKVLSAQAPFASIDVTAHAILAMTRWQSDEKEIARRELEQARDLLDKKMPKVDCGERFGDDWHDWLRCQILLREAETLIEGRPRSDK